MNNNDNDNKNQKETNIYKLTIPLFFEMLLGILVNNVDQFMLSGYSGEAVAAVGNASQICWILNLFLQVLATAALILLTQYIGAGKKQETEAIYPLALLLNIGIGIVITLVCIFGMKGILGLLNVEQGVTFEYAWCYMQIVGISFLCVAVSNCFSVFLKAHSHVKEATAIAITVNVLNVAGNAVALFLCHAGVAGVAVSTTLSRFIGTILIVLVFTIKQGKIRFGAIKQSNPVLLLRKMLWIGAPSVGENISYDVSQLVIMAFINTMGLAAVNAKIYVCLVVQFAYLFTMSLTQAMQIVEGYHIGAGERDKAERCVWKTLRIGIISSFVMTVILFLCSDWVIGVFPSADEEVLRLAKQLLGVELVLEIGRAINMTMVRGLQVAGDVKFPVLMSVLFTWLLSVMLGYYVGIVLGYGVVGLWIAMASDEILRGLVLCFRFKKGKWKKIQLVS